MNFALFQQVLKISDLTLRDSFGSASNIFVFSVKPEMTKELDWNQGDFSIDLKPVEISKSLIYIICTSSKVALICKVRRV